MTGETTGQFDRYIKHIAGDTYTFSHEGICVVIYRCKSGGAVVIDTGYEEHGELIGEYLEQQGLSLAGIIHSHIHIDHYSGNEALLLSKAAGRSVPVFIPLMDDPYIEFRDTEFMDFANADIEVYEGKSRVRAGGADFEIIDCYGHSPDSKIIVTPDGVAYLGDALMCGRPMEHARMPYAYDLAEDIRTKQRLRTLEFDRYVCAHCGDFTRFEMNDVIDANLKIFANALRYAEKTEEKCPEMENMQKVRRMLKYMGLPQFVDTDWVTDTAVQYFEERDGLKELLGII